MNKSRKQYRRNYYLKNREKDLQKAKLRYIEKRDEIREQHRDYYNRTKKQKLEYEKNKRSTDINFKLTKNLRSRVRVVMRSKKVGKRNKTHELIGCTVSELKDHLESKFLPTMSWENYGKLWHIDHIIPCNSFDLTIEEQQKKCFNYKNLQPLFAVTQIINGIEYIGNTNKGYRL